MQRVLLATLLSACAGFTLLHAQPSDPTTKMLKQLKSKKSERRFEALMALGELGPKAAPAIPALTAILPGFDEDERVLATMALGKIGKASLPSAVKLLDHEDETTRYYAVWTLALIGSDAKEHTPRLLKIFEADDDAEVRTKAAYALARIAPDSKDVFAAFVRLAIKTNEISAERVAAIDELRHFGAAAVEPLTISLKDPFVVANSIESILHVLNENKNDAVGKAVAPHLPLILTYSTVGIPLLPDADGLTYYLSKHGDQVLADLQAQMRDKDAAKSAAAITLLAQMASHLDAKGENPEVVMKAVKLALPHLKHRDHDLRVALLTLLPMNDATQAAFENLLNDDDSNIRFHAFSRLQGHGVDVIAKMQARLKAAKGDDWLRLAAAQFSCTHDPELQKALSANMKHKDADIRHRLACALSSMGSVPLDAELVKKDIVPTLFESLKSGKAEIRLQAAQGLWNWLHLGQVQPFVPEHAPALLARLDDPSPRVKHLLLNVIQRIVKADPEGILKKVVPLLEDADEEVRYAAVVVLIPLRQQCVLDLARRAEKDESQRIWQFALHHLAAMGKQGKPAVPALLRAHLNPDRQPLAAAALMGIAPDESFLHILETQMKQDPRLKKAITHPKATYEDRHKLVAALLKEMTEGDTARRCGAAYALNSVSFLLPHAEGVKTARSVSPFLTEQLARIDKELKSKDARTRIDAATTLVDLRGLGMTLDMLVNSLPGEKEWEQLAKQQAVQHERFESLIRRARSDAELQVRRQGRKAETIGLPAGIHMLPAFNWPMPFGPRVPLDGFNVPFGGGFGPGGGGLRLPPPPIP